jgi:hypothetical protein
MNKQNNCYTYFAIKGDFNPDDITAKLGLSPDKQWKIGDSRRLGKTNYDIALWEYGRCKNYDIITENQMLQTIDKLIPKIQELKEIKKKYDVIFVLQVVPYLYHGEVTPCISPSREIIEFCYHTETDISFDLYICDTKKRRRQYTWKTPRKMRK